MSRKLFPATLRGGIALFDPAFAFLRAWVDVSSPSALTEFFRRLVLATTRSEMQPASVVLTVRQSPGFLTQVPYFS